MNQPLEPPDPDSTSIMALTQQLAGGDFIIREYSDYLRQELVIIFTQKDTKREVEYRIPFRHLPDWNNTKTEWIATNLRQQLK